MRILFITLFPLSLDWGVERLTRKIADYLRKKGDIVDVLSIGKDEVGFWKKYLKNEKGLMLLRLLGAAPKDKYDLYVCNGVAAPLALKYPRKKRVVIMHSTAHGQVSSTRAVRSGFSNLYGGAVIESLERIGCENCESIIAVSKRTKDEIAGFYNISKNNIQVIEPGVAAPHRIQKQEARAALGLPDQPTLLFVGRPTREKGFDIFERLCRNISKSAKINAICAGGEAESLPKYFLARKFSEDGINAAYCASDIYVCPSKYEGFGLSIVEALAHGLPIVAFDVGIAGEAVKDRKNGFLAKNEEEMGERVCWLLLNSQKMEQFGKKSLEIARKFDLEASMRKYREYLLGVARNAGAPHGKRGWKAGKKARKK